MQCKKGLREREGLRVGLIRAYITKIFCAGCVQGAETGDGEVNAGSTRNGHTAALRSGALLPLSASSRNRILPRASCEVCRFSISVKAF